MMCSISLGGEKSALSAT